MKVAGVKTFGPSLKRQLAAYFAEAKKATGAPVDEVRIKKSVALTKRSKRKPK